MPSKKICAKVRDTKCQEEVVAALQKGSVDLEARGATFGVAAFICALVGIIAAKFREVDAAAFPSIVHVPSADVAQASHLVTAIATALTICDGTVVNTTSKDPIPTSATGYGLAKLTQPDFTY